MHWSTFALAMHDWDQPAERLLALAPRLGVRLVMPRLGEPVEPAYAEEAAPWWRAVATTGHPAPARQAAEQPAPDTRAPALDWPEA